MSARRQPWGGRAARWLPARSAGVQLQLAALSLCLSVCLLLSLFLYLSFPFCLSLSVLRTGLMPLSAAHGFLIQPRLSPRPR